MLEKNKEYWRLHQKYYLKYFDELDVEIKDAITNDPNCDSALDLNDKVEKAIERELIVEDK